MLRGWQEKGTAGFGGYRQIVREQSLEEAGAKAGPSACCMSPPSKPAGREPCREAKPEVGAIGLHFLHEVAQATDPWEERLWVGWVWRKS